MSDTKPPGELEATVPRSVVASLCFAMIGLTVCLIQMLIFPYSWKDVWPKPFVVDSAVPQPTPEFLEDMAKEAAANTARLDFGKNLRRCGYLLFGLGLILAAWARWHLGQRGRFVWAALLSNALLLLFNLDYGYAPL
jgi:hypothetical protein